MTGFAGTLPSQSLPSGSAPHSRGASVRPAPTAHSVALSTRWGGPGGSAHAGAGPARSLRPAPRCALSGRVAVLDPAPPPLGERAPRQGHLAAHLGLEAPPFGHPMDQQPSPRRSQTCISVRHRASSACGLWQSPHSHRRLTPSRCYQPSMSRTPMFPSC